MNAPPEVIRTAMLGLLVADAIGVPYEFGKKCSVSTLDVEVLTLGPKRRAHRGTPAGTWSDDGAQALCLAASLTACGTFNAEDFRARLSQWWAAGYLAVDARVFDIGITTREALESGRGADGPYSLGNGSLMRTLPMALWHEGTDQELIADAMAASAVTHAHPACQHACALYCLLARIILVEGADSAWPRAIERYAQATMAHDFFGTIPVTPEGRGYVLDSLAFARDVVLGELGFVDAVRHAISLGDDTDTSAAIGAPLTLLETPYGIPDEWLSMLRGRDLCDPVIEAFVKCKRKSA